ncbi:hypothetical protein ALP05_00504 [Pseudomonas caricapapayae]|uniref:TonB C-terminal domain-containing protein n=1 Tax=Pseudomonas caricapapayae TaxID=46678 RepID=A0A3M6F8P8_9PSED|nr:energy transducer TonB [Pseudomonas caricapapayae]RMV76930.1 hypothetical protein ALP05_00504 [Pseudomonas caricapapayae]
MSTLILSRRSPPLQLRQWPEQPVDDRTIAPSALAVQQQSKAAPRPWLANALAIALAIGLHGALAWWLTVDQPHVPEPAPPLPITVQWVPPPVSPPTAQPTPSEPAAQPEPQPPAPKAASAEPKPAESPKPKALPKAAPTKAVAKPAAPTPSAAPPTPAPVATQTPAATQTTTAPIGRAGYLDNPPPVYPPAAARRHQEGTTLLRVHVLPNGRTDQVQVLQSSGVPALDEAAQAAVRQWTFIPAKRGDTPVEGWVNVPLAFKLAP